MVFQFSIIDLPVFVGVASSGYLHFLLLVFEGLALVVFDGFEQALGILLALVHLGRVLLRVFLLAILLVLVLRALTLLVLLVLLLLVLFLVLPLLLLLLLLVLVLVVLTTATLLLLLLGLLKQTSGIGQVVARVVVLGVEFQRFLIGVDGLLELLHALLAVFHACLEETVALVVEGVGTLLVGDFGCLERLVVVAHGIGVFLLPVEGIGEVELAAIVEAVTLESPAIGDFRLVVFLFLVVAVAVAELVAVGLSRDGDAQREEQD